MAKRFPGVDMELHKVLDANMDDVHQRRSARELFKHIQLGIDHPLFKTSTDGLETKELYEVNSRGLEIFTKSWLPKNSPPKAAIFYCHGYGDTCTFFGEGSRYCFMDELMVGMVELNCFMELINTGIARKFATSGYAVFAMDYPGFGLSEGLHCYIESFDQLVDDVVEQYSKVKENPAIRGLPSFLFGQSMGGAVVLKIHLKQPDAWSGAILVAPMCKIADDMVPPWAVKKFLIGLANVLPKHKLVPQKDLAEAAFREPAKRDLTKYNVIAYKDKPRLKTALEMLRTTEEIESNLEKVSLPIIILHGEADIVTDPSVSKALYEKASSKDKKIILYEEAYHALLEGEPDEMINRVFGDIISWLDTHSLRSTAA
ncbi:hypothetical protein ACFE04_005181 [Oxalis oulophora]